MSCRKEWSNEFIENSFPMTFVKGDLRKHRRVILLAREKALLPETQPIVEQIRQERRVEKRTWRLRKIKDKYRAILATIRARKKELVGKAAKADRDINDRQLERCRLLQKKIREREEDIYEQLSSHNRKLSSSKVTKFIHKCPTEECRGFLADDYHCPLCNVNVCQKCNVRIGTEGKIDEDHKCKPEDVETMKTIRADTRPCPKCGTRIFKIEGCDQMFCTNCHTPFSWENSRD